MKKVLAIVGGLILVVVGGVVAMALMSDGFRSNFSKGFDKSFAESCQSAAVKKGATQEAAVRFCDCALVKFKETKSMDKAAEMCRQ